MKSVLQLRKKLIIQKVQSGQEQLRCSVQADLKNREKKGADG